MAVGPTREAAANAFGTLFDDLVVTDYDDFDSEVDLDEVHTIALAGDEAAELLSSILTSRPGIQVFVQVPGEPEGRDRLRDLLLAHPDVGVTGAHHVDGTTALVLGAAGADAVSGPPVATLLQTLPTSTSASPWPDEAEATVEPGEPDLVPSRPGGSPAPSRVSRFGPRRRKALAAVAVAALLATALLVAIGTSELGADGVVVTTLLGIGLLQVLTLAGLAYVVRAVRQGRAETLDFHRRMLKRTDRLAKQGRTIRQRQAGQGKRLAVLQRAAGRQQRHHEYVVELGRQLVRQHRDGREDARRLHLTTQRQVQAQLNLGDLVRLDAAVPPAGGWAASPDLLLFCVDALLAEKPSTVVECGSGLSTLFLALAAKQHGVATRVIALEHQEQFAGATRALLERHGVADVAEVRLAPLVPTSIAGHETPWYDGSAIVDITDIGLLLIDGPPTATGPQARYPAVPLLADKLAQRCTIVMDDLIRESDRETAERWASLLPDFDYSVIREFEKQVGLLRRR